MHEDRKPYQYRVILSTGEVILPDGEEAFISEKHLNGKWEILLMTGGSPIITANTKAQKMLWLSCNCVSIPGKNGHSSQS